MLANYHTHTSRCRHAIGSDEEYVKKAIAEGVKILGFSDHAPYIYPSGYESYYKMTPDERDEYYSSLSALREKYRDKIEIHIGYEAEYYPELWQKTFEFWRSGSRPEYLILGQHFVSEEYATEGLVHSITGTESEAMLKKYVDLICDAISTEKFTYIAHPDIIKFFGDRAIYRKEMIRMLEAIKSADIPIEINMLGLAEKRGYPCDEFWQIASEFEPRVLLGCDAHEPGRVADPDELVTALRFADRHRLNVIEKIDLIDPFG